jgi:hypothetical protein
VKSEQAHDPLRLVLLSALLAMSEATVLVTGAGAQMLSPLQSERRVVVVVKGSSRSLTLSEPMVWLDAGPREPPTRGVRLPAGQYALEAEDTNFLYYRSLNRSSTEFSRMAKSPAPDSCRAAST